MSLYGLIPGMTNAEYHGGPGISKSMLDAIAVSPLNFWDQYLNPDREPREDKHCFAVGDGTHKLVLEPGTFEDTYAVGFDKSAFPDALDTADQLKAELAKQNLMVSGTKATLAQRLVEEAGFPRERIMLYQQQAHEQAIKGKIPIDARSYKDMSRLLKAIWAEEAAAKLLRGGTAEMSFFWTDPAGVLRKCRTDLITSDGWTVVDLKTTDDVSVEGFGRTIAQRRYHVQAAWYLDILTALYGAQAPIYWAFIAAQKTRPYDVGVHYLTDEQIALGRAIYKRDLARLIQCQQSGIWPGVTGGKPVAASLPAWAWREIEWEAA